MVVARVQTEALPFAAVLCVLVILAALINVRHQTITAPEDQEYFHILQHVHCSQRALISHHFGTWWTQPLAGPYEGKQSTLTNVRDPSTSALGAAYNYVFIIHSAVVLSLLS